jgi:hypothetical protein
VTPIGRALVLVYVFGRIRLDLDRFALLRDGQAVHLDPAEDRRGDPGLPVQRLHR